MFGLRMKLFIRPPTFEEVASLGRTKKIVWTHLLLTMMILGGRGGRRGKYYCLRSLGGNGFIQFIGIMLVLAGYSG